MSSKLIKEPLATDKSLAKLIDAIKSVGIYPQVIDNLTSESTDEPLSAKQGKVLNDKVVAVRGNNSAYSDSATYAVGDYAIYNETLYRCKTAIVTPESFDSAKWDAVDLKTNRDAINAISGDMIHFMKAQASQETGKLTDNIRTLIANGNWMGFFLAIETMTGLPTNDPCFVLYFRTFGSSEVVVLAFNMTSNVMYMKLTHATTDYDFTEWSSI